MITYPDLGDLTVVAATRFELRAVRRAVGNRIRCIEGGIGLSKLSSALGPAAISCGLAGGLRRGLPTGSVIIPRSVGMTGRVERLCDPALVERLAQAVRALGLPVCEDPLLTTERLVRGSQREILASRGYAAVDMESFLIDAPRIACVRVVLDTPHDEIADAWEHPWSVLFTPKAWRDIPFLLREASRCAARAANVIAKAFL